MEVRIITTQAELDAVPDDYNGIIKIKSGGKIEVRKRYKYFVEVYDTSTVRAYGTSTVTAYDTSTVRAYDTSTVTAYDTSTVTACDTSTVRAYGTSTVTACDTSTVRAYGTSTVRAYGTSTVTACGTSTVTAYDTSTVTACDTSTVRAYGTSTVTAYDTSTVTACDTSTVTACDTSTVTACGNSQILNMQSDNSHIAISNNARVVYLPRNIEEYISYYNLTTESGKIKLYKAVKREEDHFRSFYDNSFKYYIGRTATEVCSDNIQVMCTNGIHVAHLDWAIKFGIYHGDFTIIEVESDVDKIVVPRNTDGKVRTSEVKVIREVPPEEWRNIR